MSSWSECLQEAPIFTAWHERRDRRRNSDQLRGIAMDESAPAQPDIITYRQPMSLVELCAQKVTSDVRLCEGCLSHGTTPSLFEHLFTAAVEKGKDLSIQSLISQWPFSSLCLGRHRGHSEQAYERQLHRWLTGDNRGVDEKESVATLSVIQSFINSLRERTQSKLRVLDLRGFPCAEYGIEYLTGHSMLSYNESQRAGIIRLVQEMATNQRITREQASAFGDISDVQTTLPEHSYAVIVDCVVESEGRPLVELCKALKISPYAHAHLKLIVNHLHLCQVGAQYVDVLLPLLDPTYLVGLNVSLNSLQSGGACHLLSSLEVGKFDALRSLDLGLNGIDFSSSNVVCQQFVSAFARLPRLSRLDLRGNRLSRRLRTLFTPPPNAVGRSGGSSRVTTPMGMGNGGGGDDEFYNRRLEYLNLSGCRLMESDFIFLSNTSLIDELRQLDLSDNDFASSTSSLCCILKRTRSTLRALRLDKCGFRNQQADRIIGSHVATMPALIGLSIAGNNDWSEEIYRREMPRLVKECATLRGVRISYPTECYQVPAPQIDEQDEQIHADQIQLAVQMRKTSFYCNLTRLLEQAKQPCRPFRLTCVDEDSVLV